MADLGRARALAMAWSLGWRITAGIVVGYYLDIWLGTTPVLTLAFAMAALVIAVRQLLAIVASADASGRGERRS